MAERVTGKVKWFNTQKGLGFLTRDDGGEDVFVHRRQLAPDPAGRYLDRGDRVEFDVVFKSAIANRPSAENVVRLETPAPPRWNSQGRPLPERA